LHNVAYSNSSTGDNWALRIQNHLVRGQ
jgi:hypothetical protein